MDAAMENIKMAVARQRLAECLAAKGLSKTPERFVLLDEIYRHGNHFDADQMFVAMRERKFRVSLATIYNNLEILTDCGLVREIRLGTKKTRYEKALGCRQHHHLVCLGCGRVVEFCDPRLGQIQQQVGKSLGFAIHGHELVLYGCCQPGCQHSPDCADGQAGKA